MMNIKTFKKRLAVYGADFSRWPEEEREVACAFMQESEHARQSHAVASKLDAALDNFDVPVPGAALKDRVTAAVFRAAQTESRGFGIPTRTPGRGFSPWPAMIPAGAVAMAVIMMLLVFPREQRAPDSPARLAQVETFMQEWERMSAEAAQDMQQTDELLEILVATAVPDPEAEVDNFLDELFRLEEDAGDFL